MGSMRYVFKIDSYNNIIKEDYSVELKNLRSFDPTKGNNNTTQ